MRIFKNPFLESTYIMKRYCQIASLYTLYSLYRLYVDSLTVSQDHAAYIIKYRLRSIYLIDNYYINHFL